MKQVKKFADQLKDKDFLVTAEYLPKAGAAAPCDALKGVPSAVNVADNPFGIGISSMAGSVALAKSGIEPIYQVVTRDRNRIAIQSDLLGAASLGITGVLCLSGYHQTLTDNPGAANVYDIDSTQLIAMVKKMRDCGELLNGAKIGGAFPMVIGAVANPYLAPIELNVLRLSQKVGAGADFIQTHAVFDADAFAGWLGAVAREGIADRTAIIAGVCVLESADEAAMLAERYTDFHIPASIIERMKAAGDAQAQKKEGIAICCETIAKIQSMKGLRGVHIISGGREECVPEILRASGLAGDAN